MERNAQLERTNTVNRLPALVARGAGLLTLVLRKHSARVLHWVWVVPVLTGTLDTPGIRAQVSSLWQTAAGETMSFEVATVKPSAAEAFAPFPLDAGSAFTPTGGHFRANFPLIVFINFAYKITPAPDQREAMLTHLPKWVATDRFAIEAKGPAGATKDQFRLMMQSLLAERFRLNVHYESRESSVYGLTLVKAGKLGPNLRPHASGPPCPATADLDSPQPGSLANSDVFPPVCEAYMFTRMADGVRLRWGSRNSSMASLASMLPYAPFVRRDLSQQGVDRPVVDQTGLAGTFDFQIEYTASQNSTSDGVQADTSGPAFPTLLRDQLGLQLKPAKAPVQLLVIDRLERPSEN